MARAPAKGTPTSTARRSGGLSRGGDEAAARGIPPERVAKTIERALSARRPRTRYLVGADARGQALAKRLLPDRAVDWLVARATGT